MAERQLRFLSGVTGHDVTKIKTRCLKCGGIKQQPSAAVLSGALPAETDVEAPPDYLAVLRASRKAEPKRVSFFAQPALPTETSIVALNAAETVPSPAFEALRDSIVAFRDGLTKKWRR